MFPIPFWVLTSNASNIHISTHLPFMMSLLLWLYVFTLRWYRLSPLCTLLPPEPSLAESSTSLSLHQSIQGNLAFSYHVAPNSTSLFPLSNSKATSVFFFWYMLQQFYFQVPKSVSVRDLPEKHNQFKNTHTYRPIVRDWFMRLWGWLGKAKTHRAGRAEWKLRHKQKLQPRRGISSP